MTLRMVPVTKAEADAYVRAHHRHLPKPRIVSLWWLGVASDGVLRGVATNRYLWRVEGRSRDTPARPRDAGLTCDKFAFGWGEWPQLPLPLT